MNGCGVRSNSNIFGDGGEARTSLSGADLNLWFTWELMRQHVVLSHTRGVFACGGCECSVPVQSGQAFGSTLAVKSVEESAFGSRYFNLRINGVRGNEQH